MTTEDFCSSEIVKLLKEKGFKCGATYSKGFVKDGDGFVGGLVRYEDKITHQMAIRWLRKVHNIHIRINPISGEGYNATIYDVANFDDYGIISDTGYFFRAEEAVEAALKYCLTELI